jgi:hypothetical protein
VIWLGLALIVLGTALAWVMVIYDRRTWDKGRCEFEEGLVEAEREAALHLPPADPALINYADGEARRLERQLQEGR